MLIMIGVVISPFEVVSVCSGGQLELTCTVAGTFLEWSFFLVTEGETMARRFSRILNPGSVPATSDLEVNSITFTFSRISANGSQPLHGIKITDSSHKWWFKRHWGELYRHSSIKHIFHSYQSYQWEHHDQQWVNYYKKYLPLPPHTLLVSQWLASGAVVVVHR